MRSWNANVLHYIHGPAVGGNFLNVHQRRSGRECHGPWINDRQSTVHGKPDPSDGIGNDRLVPLYALCTVEAVCETIFTPIRFTDCVARKRVTIYAQNMVRSCYPQRASRVLQTAIYRAGGQAVLAGINPPLSVREFIQAVWRSKPHRAIGSLQDGSNRVGAQTIRSRIGLEAAVSEAAKSSAQRSSPNCSFTILVNCINSILRESIRPCVRTSREGAAFSLKVSKPLSPPYPQSVLASANRLNDIFVQTGIRHASNAAFSEPIQSALRCRRPRAAFRVHVHRPVDFRGQTCSDGISRKCTFAKTFNAARCSRP